MNAPLIWIGFPGLIAFGLLFLVKFRKLVVFIGVGCSLLLAFLVLWLPLESVIRVGPISFVIPEYQMIFGRQFVLDTGDRSLVFFLYLSAAFWLFGSLVTQVDPRFAPLGLGITVLFTSALIVQPFLYAAIIIQIAVLVCVVLLTPTGYSPGRGVMRFLTFQTLGMPFILSIGWMLSGIEANPGDSALILNVGITAALGFGLLLSVFPFHTWIPMVAEEAEPFSSAFVFNFICMAIPLFGINFLERYNWLYPSPWLYVFFRLSGFLMVLTGGLGAMFQRHLGRLLGFAVLIDIGNSLLAMSLAIGVVENRPNFGIFFSMFLPRIISLGAWALSMSVIKNSAGDLAYPNLTGIGRQQSVATLALTLAILSFVGFPLTASFPIRLVLWSGLGQQFPIAAYAAIVGSIGLLIGGLRAIAALVMGTDNKSWQSLASGGQHLLLNLAIILILIIGIFPQWFLPSLFRMARLFLKLDGLSG